ncbi:ABC transporter substrate-binding protein [Oscillatoria sp. FACHB-1406]|uniref:ABC transporter substrate-binding protein n=1 Tax=Oscillatoria sp. FACHB-1406 TaxID=2692846 RepID=UPI001687B1A6|nr:ABC transporter substrate-binding protein [Oscillatoria sp. FACHB-1406]MBD2576912.1 amino acid ABC transporter substrate-binding protein [Oscillatoria sp. FACHB-1406]
MTQRNETPALILALLITLALLGGGFWLFKNQFATGGGRESNNSILNRGNGSATSERQSLGEKILLAADTTPQKQAGVEALAKGDVEGAIAQFQASLKAKANDPETLIYLNNAKATNRNPFKIAVSVPIGGNLDIAKEILRGVAQAQNEINQAGGINNSLLQVEITNDDNKPEIAAELARAFVKDEKILAVVGHNSSNASLAAAPEYEKGKLVMISPTSDAKALAEAGDYIFRTIPSIRFQADSLSRYAVKQGNLRNIAICIDSQAQYSSSLKEEFTSAMFADGGRIAPTNCDFAAPDFNPSTIMSKAISNGADGLLLVPSVNRLNVAIALAKENQRRLALFGSSALYTFETLKQGQANANGMVLAVPWNPEAFPGNPFTERATRLWGGQVNWRSALAYDAMQAIIAGLKQGGTSREGLKNAIASPDFSAQGATGAIQFLPSGDRNGAAILVEVKPGSKSGTGYDFVPLPPS